MSRSARLRGRLPGRSPGRLATALGVFVLAAAASAQAAEIVDGIAAQVGNDVVLVSEVNQVAGPVEKEMRSAGAPETEIAKMWAEALERLIERRLIQQVAERAEIDASDVEVDEAIEAIAKENKLTLAELRRSVELQGLAYEGYRERLREEIVQQKVISGMVRPRLRVEPEEVRRLYQERFADRPTSGQEVRVRQLLVTYDDDSPEARLSACDAVREARSRVTAGEPFERIAAELSEVNPSRGGDLGWLFAAELARWMSAVLETLEPGQVSDVVETSFGCNLLQLLERRAVEPVTYEDAEPMLRAQLLDEQFELEYRRFIDKLRSQTYIDRKGLFADAYRLEFDPRDGRADEPPLLP